jgi:SAM-dependent methyltransferase
MGVACLDCRPWRVSARFIAHPRGHIYPLEGPYLPTRGAIPTHSAGWGVVVSAVDNWRASGWSFVREELPAPPARVVEIGCGPQGGLVPLMLGAGYDAVGVDPHAPEGREYRQIVFEQYELTPSVDAVVACVSLHHMENLQGVVLQVHDGLTPRGSFVVVEWAWELFDEATARWCFDRLSPHSEDPSEHSWLETHRDRWTASGQTWAEYVQSWAGTEGMHTGAAMLRSLDETFQRSTCVRSPYFFPDLAATSESDEQSAIEAGMIRAGGIRWAGHRSDTPR